MQLAAGEDVLHQCLPVAIAAATAFVRLSAVLLVFRSPRHALVAEMLHEDCVDHFLDERARFLLADVG